MNIYTEKDVLDLLRNLIFYKYFFIDNASFMEYRIDDYDKFLMDPYLRGIYTSIKMKYSAFLITTDILLKIITDDMSVDQLHNLCLLVSEPSIDKDRVEALNHFIKAVPLEEVPLFVNTYPEIASWRLRIGK